MPTVDRVMREVRTDDSKQTALLQMQALWELTEIIKELSGPREFGRGANGLTPDESRLVEMYNNASNQLFQESNEKFPGPYGKWKKFSLNVRRYPRNNPHFGVEGTQLFQRFFSADLRASFDKALGVEAARHQAFQEKEQASMNAPPPPESTAGTLDMAPITKAFMSGDPGSKFTRRCLELGGSQMECMGKGLAGSLFGLIGMNPTAMSSHAQPGLRITGIYHSESGLSLTFKEDSVGIGGFGNLVDMGFSYGVTMQGNKLLIQVAADPQPFVLTWAPDGKLTGPGLTTLAGKVITGYRNVLVTSYNEKGEVIPGSQHWVKEPIYAPKTERAQIGSLNPTAGTPTVGSAIASVEGLFAGQSIAQASNNSMKGLTAPGPRLEGQYSGSGGLSMEFHTAAVILDCGEAHVARPYALAFTTNQGTVSVNNGGTPFSLALQPNGSLSGSGAIDVSGRVIVGSNSSGFVFAPRNARCAISTLAAN